MAKVWLVHGTKQNGPELTNRPWVQCVALLEIDSFSRVETRPKFGETSDPYWPTHVVVELESGEASQVGTEPGFFVSPLSPDTAEARLEANP